MSSEFDDNHVDGASGVATLTRPKVKEPPLYQVILLNDDYTTMEFVVHVLEKFFFKSAPEAEAIMLSVHNEGRGICGVYPRDMAETKTLQVNDYSRKHEMPLKCIWEKA
jgi:ATP-dependent Clp protease adaptor protein ClpS